MPVIRAILRLLAQIGLATIALPIGAQVARVTNTATLSFAGAGGRETVSSNQVSLDIDRTKRPTKLSFHLLPPGYELEGMRCDTAPVLRLTPAPIDADTLARAPLLATLDTQTPMIFDLENPGGNHDPNVRETALITVTTGTYSLQVPLLETGPNSGEFAGGVPEGGADADIAACDPTTTRNAHLKLSFAEDAYSYASEVNLLIDPAGYVFDSQTGALVDGAEITLVDESGQPAKVFGDDGVSAYPSTVTTGGSATDASGRTYPFKQGNYRFPMVATGRYRLQIKPPPGYDAPSSRDVASLQALRGPGGDPFILNDASFGRPFTLDTPDPFFSDVPMDRNGQTVLLLTKTASVREASPGDFVQYRVHLTNRGEMAVRNVHLTDILPAGLRFEAGSQRGAPAPTLSADGHGLDFLIERVEAGASVDVTYVVSVAPGAPSGEAVNRVLASGGGGATGNEAAAAVRLKPLLFTDGVTLIGRVTAGECGDPTDESKGVGGIRIVLDDGTYVVTDREGLYHFEGVRPGSHVVQLDTASVPASYEAVACRDDTRQAGNAFSRFVESQGGLLKRVDFRLRPTGKQADLTDTLPIKVADDATAAGNRNWFAGLQPGTEILFPTADYNPRAPALRVVIKHRPDERVALKINGVLSDPLAFDGTEKDPIGLTAISRWTGLPLVEGDNNIEALVLDASGRPVTTLARVVHSSSIPASAVATPEYNRAVADGLTRPLIAIRISDRDGKPVRAGTVVRVHVAQPYAVAVDADVKQARDHAPTGTSTQATARVVGDNGLAFVTLEPTMQAGKVDVQVLFGDGPQLRTTPITAWLSAPARKWMVVGFGRGTFGYDVLRKHGRSLPADAKGGTVVDGELALYAKGRIKGSWLATIAYGSDRQRDRSRGLLGQIDPDRYYSVYGDGTQQGYDAASARKLYLRLERREFYAMFGDYETGFTDTQLGRFSRTLNGAKLAYEGSKAAFAAFAAHDDQLYSRDEIQGNGLSGPYRLSGRDIVPNSDKLRIEVRDRFRSELIVSSTPMTRHIDYDVDPVAGTIRFREPVLTRDADLNPVFIIVDYETYGGSRKRVAGAHGAVRLAHGKVEVGATALHDGTASNASLIAANAKAKIGRDAEVRAEVATGGRGGLNAGRAWLVEAEHHDKALDLLVYAREQDIGFGLGQQNLVEAGSRKIGVDGRWRATDRLSLTASTWHQVQDATGGMRTATDGRIEWRRDHGTVFAGATMAFDRGIDGQDRTSRLLTVGGSQSLFGDKLTLTAQTQFAPGGDKASVDFPVRHQVEGAYRISPGIRLLAGYEIADGKEFAAHTIRAGFDVAPWAGAKLTGTLNQQGVGMPVTVGLPGAENGRRTYAQYGLNQSLPLGANWTVDATLDASSTVRGRIPAGAVVNAFQPIASGGTLAQDGTNGDYAAVTFGANYRASLWSWNGRAEYRHADTGDRWGLTSNLLRSLGEGRTLAAALRWNRIDQGGNAASSLAIDLSMAWRPLGSHWSLLERLSFRNESANAGVTSRNLLGIPATGDSFQASLRVINNIAINYRSANERGHGFEASFYYGAKWVRGSFGLDDYAGFVQVVGFDLRKDLGRHFDVGVQASAQHAVERKSVAFSAGPTLGVSPARNVWISVGYNISGYRDRDFSEDRYSRAGPFVTMRLKFDQQGIGNVVRAIGGRR